MECLPETQSSRRLAHHQSGVKQLWRTRSDQSVGSGWCKSASRCPSCDGRCHRWPHCPPWRRSQSVPRWCELSEWSCKVPLLLLTLEVLGRWRTPVWISCRSQQTNAPEEGTWSQSQYRHQRNGKQGILANQCTDQPDKNDNNNNSIVDKIMDSFLCATLVWPQPKSP